MLPGKWLSLIHIFGFDADHLAATVFEGDENAPRDEDVYKRQLLKNPHKTILTVKPVQGLTTRKDEALHDRLQAYKNTLSEEEVLAIVENTKALREYQEAPDTKEALETIPLLKREDMKKEATPYINEERELAGSTLLVHDIFTNAVSYTHLFTISSME